MPAPLLGRRIPKARQKGKPGDRQQAPQPSLAASLHALRQKYLALAALRRVREAAEARGIERLHGPAARQRQQQARALAAAFPGALRELEGFDAQAFWQRAGEVQAEWWAVQHGVETQPRRLWVRCVLDFHALIAEAQAVRTWLRQSGARADHTAYLHGHGADLVPTYVPAFRRWYLQRSFRQFSMHAVDAAFLRRYLRRPGANLWDGIWGELSRRHKLPTRAVRRAVLGHGCT